ncbi:hypothetical protein F4604DRAFT_1938561 [Suillus subluteus]|nr:hypothetical protein F4604DRAFT_1938561 [Suillus subluteus]
MAYNSKTDDYGIKMASLMLAPYISDVHTMDKLTDCELNRLIVKEEEPPDNVDEPFSFMLARIFRSFTVKLPDVMELRVPLHKICYHDHRLHSKFALTDEQDLVPLFDEDEQQWNWALPMSHLDEPRIDRIEETIGEGPEGNENEMSGSGVNDSLPEGPSVALEAWKHPFEEIFASFFNTISGALSLQQPKVMEANQTVVRTWSSANATRPVKDEEIYCKPDLVLLDDMTARWDMIKVVCELTSQLYSPQSTIGKTIDSKAYLLLRRQPWRRFVLLLSLTNGYCDLRVHMYDHSGGVVMPCVDIVSNPNIYLHILSCLVFSNLECIGYNHSILIFMKTRRPAQLENTSILSCLTTNRLPAPDQAWESLVESPVDEAIQVGTSASTSKATLTADPPKTEIPTDPLHTHPPQPIGKILVNDHTYDILELIFSSQGLVGRGTVHYLARRHDEEYIVTDHWVLGDKDVALNEVAMLQVMQGVRGVPQLIEYWLVETKPQEVDEMMSYCGKIWKSIQELVSAIRDIVRIQQIAVEEHGILHRDCSLNNAMIEDDGNGSHGTLINWEFAGTLPFMSRLLLFQLSEAVGSTVMSQNSWKHASHSRAKVPPLIMHGYQDDLEPVFYIFIWICIGYRGPLGVKHVLEKRSEGQWLLHLWSADSFKEGSNKKTSFFFHPHADKLSQQFHPYFHDLLPLALDWYELIRGKGPSRALTFKEVIDLLTKHLDILPKDEPSRSFYSCERSLIHSLVDSLDSPTHSLVEKERWHPKQLIEMHLYQSWNVTWH